MDNQLDDKNWKLIKEHLKEQIAKAEDQQGLADEQLVIINKMILEPLERTDRKTIEFLGVLFTAFIMVGWLKLGFLPSQFEPLCHELGLELTATFFRMFPTSKASNAPSPSGVSQFWDGIICKEMYNWDDSKNAFDLCLSDPSLAPWMRVTALQLKAWHHVRLQEYDSSRETLQQLRDNLSVSKPTVDYLMGYIKALEDSGRGSLHYELHHDEIFVMVPEAAPGELKFLPQEVTKTWTLAEGVLLTGSIVAAIKDLFDTQSVNFRLDLWHLKEEIISGMPSLERTKEKLITEYGDWVNELVNQGALVNAEFLYEALRTRSWGGVIIEYSSAVEAEIKARLLPRLENFLKRSGTSLQTILPKRVDRGDSNLGYAEAVLKATGSNPFLKQLLSILPSETLSFLFQELTDSLKQLRELRNCAAHGGVINASEAKQIRKLVIGTPEKPGFLKRLAEINLLEE